MFYDCLPHALRPITRAAKRLTAFVLLAWMMTLATWLVPQQAAAQSEEECRTLDRTLSVDDVSVNEDAGNAELVLRLNCANEAADLTVNYATADDSATAGQDYTETSGTATIPRNTKTVTVMVPILNDSLDEDDEESFSFTLSNPSSVADLTGGTATVTIRDNDQEPTVLMAANLDVDEDATNASVFVTLSARSGRRVTFDYATSDGGARLDATAARAGEDYTETSGTVTFEPGGVIVTTLTIPITDDNMHELPNREIFTITLSNLVNVRPDITTSTVTIRDDDPQPFINVTQNLQWNEDIGEATLLFSLTNAVPSTEPGSTTAASSNQIVTASYTTADGTATAGQDYTATSGTITFNPGETLLRAAIPITNDNRDDADEETFTVTLSDVVNAQAGRLTGTGTIVDDDPQPVIDVATGLSWDEDVGRHSLFIIGLDPASNRIVTASYTTVDGTALAGQDYTTTSGTVTFNPGETVFSVPLPITNDNRDEEDVENFTLMLSDVVNAQEGNLIGTAAIRDDDPQPFINVTNASRSGESDGESFIFFTLADADATRRDSVNDAPSNRIVTASYTTADGTATAGQDYTATSGTITFNPGETLLRAAIPITNDNRDDADEETFTVTLSDVVNAQAGRLTGTGTIVDDDPQPVIDVATGLSWDEDVGRHSLFIIGLDPASNRIVTASYTTVDGTALAGQDYTTTSGTVTFNPGETVFSVPLPITNDNRDEEDVENFTLTLSDVVNAQAGNLIGTAAIRDDDPQPTVSVASADASVEEDAGPVTFTVSLSAASGRTVTATVRTEDDTGDNPATADDDYTAVPLTTLTFSPDQTERQVSVTLGADDLHETDETFRIVIDAPEGANAILGTASVTATIENDDDPPVVSVTTTESVNEDEGSAVFTISLDGASGLDATVDYDTVDGTATAGVDYTGVTGGAATIDAGGTETTVEVVLTTDTRDDVDRRTFTLRLTGATGATLSEDAGSAEATIADDDPTPSLRVEDVTVNEGAGSATFTIELSAPSNRTVTASYATADGSALDGQDYTATSGTATFDSGETEYTVTVPITDDDQGETAERFTLALTGLVNALEGRTSATATIVDNDSSLVLDVDGNGSVGLLTDGLLVVRYLVGAEGSALTSGAVADDAHDDRNEPDEIAAYLQGLVDGNALDADGNEAVGLLTDGLLIVRYLVDIRGAALTAGAVADDAHEDRNEPDEIAAYIASLLPPT